MPAGRFIAAVAETAITPDGTIPRLGPPLIRRYIEDLKAVGLI